MKSFGTMLKRAGSHPTMPKTISKVEQQNSEISTHDNTSSKDNYSSIKPGNSLTSDFKYTIANHESNTKTNKKSTSNKNCPDVLFQAPSSDSLHNVKYGNDLNKMILKLNTPASRDNLVRTESNRIHPTECLIEAVYLNNSSLVKTILNDSRVNIAPALLIAASEGHLSIVRMLINYEMFGTPNNIEFTPDYTIRTRRESGIYGRRGPALIAAARNNRVNVVEYLLFLEADGVEAAIIESLHNNHLEIFNMLILKDKKYDKNKILIEAALAGNLIALKKMIRFGAENIDGALMCATSKGHLNIVEYLIEKHNGYISGALSVAMENGRADIVIYICRKNNKVIV